MGRITDIFADLRSRSARGLMPFVTAGYPSLDVTRRALPAIDDAGASIIEVGFPFTDPIADGPVIAASMHEALQQGVTPEGVFHLVAEVRSEVDAGLVAMVSASIVFRLGLEAFATRCAKAGFDGLIVPDLDLDAAARLGPIAAAHGLTLSMLAAPTTTGDRLAAVANASSGFLYMLARAGVTGESSAAPDIAPRVAAARAVTDLPLAVGFGVSTPAHVAAIVEHADAAIVGSALVRRMGEASDPVEAAASFTSSLASGLAPAPT